MSDEMDMEPVAETENFTIVKTVDENGAIYHIELGGVSLHLMPEEWEEFVILVKSADK